MAKDSKVFAKHDVVNWFNPDKGREGTYDVASVNKTKKTANLKVHNSFKAKVPYKAIPWSELTHREERGQMSYEKIRSMEDGGKMKQGYNDRMDDSLGNRTGKASSKEQDYKDRRDESKAMNKAEGKRAYQSVGTMDKMASGGLMYLTDAQLQKKIKSAEIGVDRSRGVIQRDIKKRLKQFEAEKKRRQKLLNEADNMRHRRELEAEKKAKMASGGKVDRIYEMVANSIFIFNSKGDKVNTEFGSKTRIGLANMIANDNYSSNEVANAIFDSNEKNGKIKTSLGDKTLKGLVEVIDRVRSEKMAHGGEITVSSEGGQKDVKIPTGSKIRIERYDADSDVYFGRTEMGMGVYIDGKDRDKITTYAEGGGIDGQTFRSAVLWAQGDIEENYNYEDSDLNIQHDLMSDHTELYKAANKFGIQDEGDWREIYEVAFEEMGIENPPQFKKGGSMESGGEIESWVGEKESKGYPVYVRKSGYPTQTISFHKSKELAEKKADKLGGKTYAEGGKTDDWIQGVEAEMKKKGTVGAFTKQAKRAGMTVKEFTKEVLDNPDKYSKRTRERAQFAKNVSKYESGGLFDSEGRKYSKKKGAFLTSEWFTGDLDFLNY